jgi:transposase-like protein
MGNDSMVSATCVARRRWTEAEARAALAAWEGSGVSLAEFARHNGLEVQRLARWRRRLAAERGGTRAQAAPEFIEVHAEGSGTARGTIEVVLRSGRVLRVAETIAPSVLEQLASALER